MKHEVINWDCLPVLMTTQHMSKLLGFNVQVIRDMAFRGDIPAKKVGKKSWFFEKSQIMEYFGVKK